MKKELFLSVLIAQTSCYKEIEIDIPEVDTLPVVNSIFQPDSIFSITLTKTRGILSDTGLQDVDNANVLLYLDERAIDTLVYEKGTYTSDISPVIGENYGLSINIPGFQALSSSDKIPEAPSLAGASFRDSVYTNSDGYFVSQAEITFADDPNEENYYELILKHLYDEEEWIGLFGPDVPYAPINAYFDNETNDLVLENEGQLGFIAFKNPVFSDELFNGQTYTMRANYGPTWVFDSSSPAPDLIVILRSVSKDYYTYKKSLTAHIETQSSDIWDGVVEPSSMFTNIEGGYGIFAGFSQVSDTIFKK